MYAGFGSSPPPDQDGDNIPDFAEEYFGTSPTEPDAVPFTVTHTPTETSLGWPVANPAGVNVTPKWSPDQRIWLESGQSAPGFPARTLTIFTQQGQSQAVLGSGGLPSAFIRIGLEQP